MEKKKHVDVHEVRRELGIPVPEVPSRFWEKLFFLLAGAGSALVVGQNLFGHLPFGF